VGSAGEEKLFYAAANAFLHTPDLGYAYRYAQSSLLRGEGEAKTGVTHIHEQSNRKEKERVQMANLLDTLQAEGTFTTLIRFINMTEIAATLREPGAYTMFAPPDAAFAQMKAEQVEHLFEDYYNASKLVKYHLVLGLYRTTDLLDRSFLKTMEGQRLIISSSASNERDTESLVDGTDAHGYVVRDTITETLLESIKVNGARITRGNVSADNGLIHVIDKVLVPRFMIL
jgi:uncharacterized surface protein with fasciclin (FAS1) repeats